MTYQETFTYKNATIRSVNIDHTPFSPDQEVVMRDTIQNSDEVILEYYPDEIQTMDHNALIYHVTNIDSILPEAKKLVSLADEYHKDITLLDPAYNTDFALIRGGVWSPLAVAAAGLYYSTFIQNDSQKMTRRRLCFGFIAPIVCLGYIIGVPMRSQRDEDFYTTPQMLNLEATFRRAIVAQGISRLASDPSRSKTQIGMFYPSVHIKGIQDFLQNTDKLNTALSLCRNATSPLLHKQKTFFTGRKYLWTPNGRVKQTFQIT
jgi:hypothetical protein